MNKYRILIVDDETIFRTGLLHLCNWKSVGIEIVGQAANGAEALELMEKTHPNIVITDIMMPVMDGIELVKRIKTQYPAIKIIILSSYSEYEHVREVFKYGVEDYLLKPKVTAEELITIISSVNANDNINNITPILKDPSLIVSQWFEYDNELNSEEVHILQQYFDTTQFTLLTADISMLQQRTHVSQHELEQFVLSHSNYYLSKFKFLVVFTKEQISLIIGENESKSTQANQNLQINQLIKFINSEYTELKFILVDYIQRLQQIKLSFIELQPLLQKTIYFNERGLILEPEIIKENKDIPFDHDKFSNLVKWMTFNKGLELISNYLDEVSQAQAMDAYILKRFMQHTIYTVMSSTEHLNLPISSSGAEKLKWFKQIDNIVTINELKATLRHFFDIVNVQFMNYSEHNESKVLNQIIDYIHQHYADDISLSELAERFHMNYSYLSSYFKQGTNENLTAYITRIRIDKAKLLLAHSDETVSQISSKIGFSEHNYFSKVFKKVTGMTPIEYRQSITE